jgi:hypothetical protein
MKYLVGWALLASVVSCAGTGTGTGGTETGNPASLEHFAASDCKSRAPEPGQQALLLASAVDGLQCVEWSRDAAGALDLRLSNFPEPCGDKYLGAAHVADDGALELSVYKDSCEVFRCGTCVFDFDFRLSGIEAESPLELRTGTATCESAKTTWEEALSLAIDEQPSGVRCRYLRRNVLDQYASSRGTCGQRNMPCGDCSSVGPSSCADGLTCSSVADGDARCLASCSSDDDCGGAMACRDGSCQSQTDW